MKNQLSVLHESQQTPEEITIAAVMAATDYAFNVRSDRQLTAAEMIKTCAALIRFLEHAQAAPQRTFAEWKSAIEGLTITLGSSK